MVFGTGRSSCEDGEGVLQLFTPLASPDQTWHMSPGSVMICEGPLICSLMARELRGSRYEGLHHGRTEKGSLVSLTACAP